MRHDLYIAVCARPPKSGAAAVENNMEGPPKIKNRVTMWPSNTSSGCIPPKFENIYSQMYMSCAFYNNDPVWLNKLSFYSKNKKKILDGWKEKQI